MALTDYTTYDTVRAVLGVSPKELKDETLALDLWEQQFLLEMSDVDGGGGAAATLYAAIKLIDEGSRSAQQTQFFNVYNMLAGYSVARQLLSPQVMFSPIRITDGRAEIERFKDSNFDRVREGVQSTYSSLLKRLTTLLVAMVPGATVPVPTTRRVISSVGLGTDPVTGA